jgi:hypothetical protein
VSEEHKNNQRFLVLLLHLPAALPCVIAAQSKREKGMTVERSVKNFSVPRGFKGRRSAGAETKRWFEWVSHKRSWSHTGKIIPATTQTGCVLLPAVVLYTRSFAVINRKRTLITLGVFSKTSSTKY